ncbi:MAG: Outer membrane protein assembly factor BamD [candidate division BRC1 bacterium ADurb.BinA364]|nr:MAG: Outer membrane protein assembly factor BamD [candidate division BRC1 bacterium ADurb.BinA364]
MRAALDSFVKARVNAAQEREFALYYRVQAYPTIVFFDSQGRELDRFTGYIDPPMFLKLALEAVDPKTNYVALKERLRANPGDVEALYYMGYKYARRGEDDRAEGYFARVEELDAKNEFGFHDNIALRRAERLANGEDPAQALAALERLRAKYPDADERERADLLWARTLWRAGRSQDALQAYSAFLQQYPQSDQRGQVEAALAALQAGAL